MSMIKINIYLKNVTDQPPYPAIIGLEWPMKVDERTTVTCNVSFYRVTYFNFTWALGDKILPGFVPEVNSDGILANYSSVLNYTFDTEDDMTVLTCCFSAAYEDGYHENATSVPVNLQCELDYLREKCCLFYMAVYICIMIFS